MHQWEPPNGKVNCFSAPGLLTFHLAAWHASSQGSILWAAAAAGLGPSPSACPSSSLISWPYSPAPQDPSPGSEEGGDSGCRSSGPAHLQQRLPTPAPLEASEQIPEIPGLFQLMLGPYSLWGGAWVSKTQGKIFSTCLPCTQQPTGWFLQLGCSPGPCLVFTAGWVMRNISFLQAEASQGSGTVTPREDQSSVPGPVLSPQSLQQTPPFPFPCPCVPLKAEARPAGDSLMQPCSWGALGMVTTRGSWECRRPVVSLRDDRALEVSCLPRRHRICSPDEVCVLQPPL